jgi:hypothetical protein
VWPNTAVARDSDAALLEVRCEAESKKVEKDPPARPDAGREPRVAQRGSRPSCRLDRIPDQVEVRATDVHGVSSIGAVWRHRYTTPRIVSG